MLFVCVCLTVSPSVHLERMSLVVQTHITNQTRLYDSVYGTMLGSRDDDDDGDYGLHSGPLRE